MAATTDEKEDLSSYILGEDEEVRELFGLNEVVIVENDETKTKDAEVSNTWSQWSLNVAPTLKFPIHTKRMKKEDKDDLLLPFEISIRQNDRGYGELGTRVWDAAIVLSTYLDRHVPSSFWHSTSSSVSSPKRVLELGSGTGLVGIVAGLKGAEEMILTDQARLLRLLNYNIETNVKKFQEWKKENGFQEEKEIKIRSEELFWGNGNPFPHKFHTVLGSDLTYEMEDLEPLIRTMNDVLEDERGEEGEGDRPQVLLAYGRERAAMEPFFEIASRYFEWKKVFSFPSDEELEKEKKREQKEGEDFSPSQLGWVIDVISMTKIMKK